MCDGLQDGKEIDWGLDPTNPDTDGDGLTDGEEVGYLNGDCSNYYPWPLWYHLYGNLSYECDLNGNSEDTDGDEMGDAWEAKYETHHGGGTGTLDPRYGNDRDNDLQIDNDGLTNIEEYNIGTDPTNPDTDGDGQSDGDEYGTTDPLEVDTDGDGLVDGYNGEVLKEDYPEGVRSLKDGPDLDFVFGELSCGSDPSNNHTDSDDMADGWEADHWNGQVVGEFNPGTDTYARPYEDRDGDLLSNRIESEHYTNPWVDDSDGDGLSDRYEITFEGYNYQGNPPAYPPTTEPILAGHWKMDKGSGIILYDSSENENDGDIYGAAWETESGQGTVLEFDDDDYVDLGKPTELEFGSDTDFTISLWIKPDDDMVSEGRLIDNEAGDGKGIRLNFTSDGKRLQSQIKDVDGDSITINGLSAIGKDEWHHVALSADRTGNCILYVNGKQDGSVSMGFIDDITSTANFTLGGNGTEDFLGRMDNLIIFSKALSKSAIDGLVDGGSDYNGDFDPPIVPPDPDNDDKPIFPAGTGTNPKGVDYDLDGELDGWDTDGDGLSDGEEITVGTDPRWFDTDGDLLPDGWEVEYGLYPKIPNFVGGVPGEYTDSDGDSANDFDELRYGTDPSNLADNPAARMDAGTQYANLRLTVGDPSGSESERYVLQVGDSVKHQSLDFGSVDTEVYPFEIGKKYDIIIKHQGSNLDIPDYDYTASIEAVDTADEWMVIIDDPDGTLGYRSEEATPGPDNKFYAKGKKAYLTIGGKLEVFRDPGYTKPLDDWPQTDSLPRSPKYIFGENDPIYVQALGLGTDPDTAETIYNAVKVTSGSGGEVYLTLKETGANTQTFRNSVAPGTLLYLSITNQGGTVARISVVGEEVLTFSLRRPPIGSPYTYTESANVMVDLAEIAAVDATHSRDAKKFSDGMKINNWVSQGLFDSYRRPELGTDDKCNVLGNKADFMWISGHCHTGQTQIYAQTNSYGLKIHGFSENFTPSDITGGKWASELDWFVLSVCSTCEINKITKTGPGTQWVATLQNGGHAILGYRGGSPPYLPGSVTDVKVTERFVKYLKTKTVKDAWIDANYDYKFRKKGTNYTALNAVAIIRNANINDNVGDDAGLLTRDSTENKFTYYYIEWEAKNDWPYVVENPAPQKKSFAYP